MKRHPIYLIALAALMTTAVTTSAQEWKIIEDDGRCDRWDSRYCEIREITLPADRDVIKVDGGNNGGIHVRGWDRHEIRLRARISIWEGDRDEAKDYAKDIEIELDRTIEAVGPRSFWHRDWSVSFELMVPHESNLKLEANNGGISIEDVDGEMTFGTTNGGISLAALAGDVQGRTTNGGVTVELDGKSWKGYGLDVKTTNGGVKLYIPDGYSADLETGTTNGQIELDFPVTVEGIISKKIHTSLGDGGAKIRVTTTNGGVRVRKS